jgi:ribose-phosphate pyrophosphokinase
MEFLLLADAIERAGAKQVTAIIPWLAYSLQDKVFREGEPLAARMIADLISHSFVHRVVLLDLHNPSISGFFSVPTEHVRALALFKETLQQTLAMEQAVVVSPDFGGIKQARVFADAMSLDLVNIDKQRDLQTGVVTPVGMSGEVQGKLCLVYDDVINTGSTAVEVAKFLKNAGASAVHFIATHGIFAQQAVEKLSDPAIDSVIVTNSIFHQDLPKKIKVINISLLLSQTLTW